MVLWCVLASLYFGFSVGQSCDSLQCVTCEFCSVTSQSVCPVNTESGDGAVSVRECLCVPGAQVNVSNQGLACALCLAGSYAASSGMTACTLCGVGTYLPGTGSFLASDCLGCPAGTFQGGTGATAVSSCSSCGVGTYSVSVGASSSSTCVPCNVGFYSLAVGAPNSSTCQACGVGFYCSTVGTAPAPCTRLSSNAYWISTGTTPSNCAWACSPQYYMNPTNTSCVSCPTGSWCTSNVVNQCPLNSNSPALSSVQNQCTCQGGYYGNGSNPARSPCVVCPSGSWCGGGNGNTTVSCPANSTSPTGAASVFQCQCLPGYYGPNGSACALCPPNSLCTSGTLSSCPANSQSVSGSSGLCTCNAGFYSQVAGGPCVECPVNGWCAGGLHQQNCVAHAISPVRSV